MKQQEALSILKTGANVFLTGPAGCGKTFLLNKYIRYLKKNKINIGITATTGIAATYLNGRTIHSWSGVGIKDSVSESQLKKLQKNEVIRRRIMSAKVLIIDEISMFDSKRLDMVDHVCKALRQDLRPFGGMQAVLCGDFFQLPPIARKDEERHFVTKSEIWNDMDLKICYFEEQHRQADKKFLQVLNDIRESKVNDKTYKILKSRINRPIDINIRPTKLHTHNFNVDSYNLSELDKIKGEEKVFKMKTKGKKQLVESLQKSYCLAPAELRIKIGAVVMFVKNNFGKKYANGTLGKVVGFDSGSGYPVVETLDGEIITAGLEKWVIEENDEIVASVDQVPLRLAWAITVHKSQGMSLDCAEIDLSRTFEYGMGYVALSRVRSLDGIRLKGINKLALKVHKEASRLDKKLLRKSAKDLKEFKAMSSDEIKKIQKKFVKNNQWEDSHKYLFGTPL